MAARRLRIAAHALHAVARVSLRVRSPLAAKRIVDAVGKALPRLGLGEAMELGTELECSGTCLSRALAIAALLPDAEVVIGTDGAVHAFSAHAWVERDGVIVTGAGLLTREIARL